MGCLGAWRSSGRGWWCTMFDRFGSSFGRGLALFSFCFLGPGGRRLWRGVGRGGGVTYIPKLYFANPWESGYDDDISFLVGLYVCFYLSSLLARGVFLRRKVGGLGEWSGRSAGKVYKIKYHHTMTSLGVTSSNGLHHRSLRVSPPCTPPPYPPTAHPLYTHIPRATARVPGTMSTTSFSTLYPHLLHTFTPPLSPAYTCSSPHPPPPTLQPDPTLTPLITSLSLHPTLESALHLLNSDLPSAHFLLRKMQSPPATESMYLHAILHKLEGDLSNAKAWYCDVSSSDVARFIGGSERRHSGQITFLGADEDDAGKWASGKAEEVGREGERAGRGEAEARAGWGEGLGMRDVKEELRRAVEWCSGRFGTGRWEDARVACVRPDERICRIGGNMVTGDGSKTDPGVETY